MGLGGCRCIRAKFHQVFVTWRAPSRPWFWRYARVSAALPVAMLVAALVPELAAADWRALGERAPMPASAAIAYRQATALRESDGARVDAHLAFFHSRAFRLAVVDLPSGLEASEARIDRALRAAGLPAGVNGGFFHPDRTPLGLVIAEGRRINRLERARLLSGVLYSDADGNHLLRMRAFRDHVGIHALLQSGPYLVEHGRAVRGLSAVPAARRTFVATDWRGHWVLGATRNALSLAELADCLASPGCLTDWPVERALNLDGGSSTGFFFADAPGQGAVILHPLKPVRNLLGVRPR